MAGLTWDNQLEQSCLFVSRVIVLILSQKRNVFMCYTCISGSTFSYVKQFKATTNFYFASNQYMLQTDSISVQIQMMGLHCAYTTHQALVHNILYVVMHVQSTSSAEALVHRFHSVYRAITTSSLAFFFNIVTRISNLWPIVEKISTMDEMMRRNLTKKLQKICRLECSFLGFKKRFTIAAATQTKSTYVWLKSLLVLQKVF